MNYWLISLIAVSINLDLDLDKALSTCSTTPPLVVCTFSGVGPYL